MRVYRHGIVALLLLLSGISQASTLEKLQRDGHLRVDYRIATESVVIQHQPVTLEIEVSTDRWFARGTKIPRFEIDGAVVYRGSELSTNSSRIERGQTWAVQLWTLVFYPQKSGTIELPEIEIFVSIDAVDNIAVEGVVILPAKSLEVVLPSEMQGMTNWVATNRLSITETYEGLKDSYQPGDAITRTVEMVLDDAPAMMLPAINMPVVDGLGLYVVPPKVFEKSNRGTLVGYRVEQFIYTIERAGAYQLPEQSFTWWNLNSGTKEVISLGAVDVVTEGFDATIDTSVTDGQELFDESLLTIFVGSLLAVVGSLLLVWILQSLGMKQRLQALRQARSIRRDFVEAVKQGRAIDALQYLYIKLESCSRLNRVQTLEGAYQSDCECLLLLTKLKQQAFSAEADADAELTKKEAKQLFDFFIERRSMQWPWQKGVYLSLNRPV